MNKAYFGYTIGPIHGTLMEANSPAEIWMASYFFSRLMQEVTRLLLSNQELRDADLDLVSPCLTDFDYKELTGLGAGVFSDRLYYAVNEGKEDRAKMAFASVWADALASVAPTLVTTINADGPKPGVTDQGCIQFLQEKLYYRETCVIAETIPLKEINDQLDELEAGVPFPRCETVAGQDYFYWFLRREVLRAGRCPWIKEQQVVPLDMFQLADEQEPQQPSDAGEPFSRRYVALVYADGDLLGTVLSQAASSGAEQTVRDISKKLLTFSKNSVRTVKEYGGYPLFFGGDDLFFFAPLYSADKERNLFSLLSELHDQFGEMFKDHRVKVENEMRPVSLSFYSADKKQKLFSQPNKLHSQFKNHHMKYKKKSQPVSLSFGVTIHHCKYPLQRMRSDTEEGLYVHAKGARWRGKNKKNALYVMLRKGSGQRSKCLLPFISVDEQQKTLVELAQELIFSPGDEQTVRSLHWKLVSRFDLLCWILEQPDAGGRLTTWLKNISNQDSQRGSALTKVYCDRLVAFMLALWRVQPDAAAYKETLDGVLRISEFIARSAREEKV